MKVDAKARALLIKGIYDRKQLYDDCFDHCITMIAEADTVEDVMLAKQTLLHTILFYFPINSDVCYFCIDTEHRCTKCEYAKHHGYCGVNDSLWCKLSNMIQEADGFVVEEYVKRDEKYE